MSECVVCDDEKQITVRSLVLDEQNSTVWKHKNHTINERFVMNNSIDIDEEAKWHPDTNELLFIKMTRVINCPYCTKE